MPRKKTTDHRQLSLFEQLASNPEKLETMLFYHKVKKANFQHWRGLIAVPAGSLLEKTVHLFSKKTDIPLEIPFFTMLHYLSFELMQKNVSLKFGSRSIGMDLWTVILADSGSGKTLTSSVISDFTNVKDEFPECAGGAAFINALSEHNGQLWIRDEIGKFMRSLETQAYMAEIKDYLLRVRDGKKLTRSTKKDTITVENPQLSILGFSVTDTFKNEVGADSMVDGFAQRFLYIVAKEDADRKYGSVPLYKFTEEDKEAIMQAWVKTVGFIKEGKQYVITEDAEKAFCDSFELLMPQNVKVPMSFFRRIMYRAFPYALLYHVLQGKENLEIDAADIAWSARVCALHIEDASLLLSEHNMPDFERILQAAERVKAKVEAEGRACTARDIVRGVRGIRNAKDAESVLQIISSL